MLTISSTPGSLFAQRSLLNISKALSQSLQRLATGYRINRGADDPAGLIMSEKLRAALADLEAESKSLQRADSVIATADAGIGEISGLLNRAESLTIANANTAGLSEEERRANQMEIDSILRAVDRISDSTEFNGSELLDGSATVSAAGDEITIDSVRTSTIGEVTIDGEDYTLADVKSGGALDTVDGDISGAQQAIDAARTDVATLRGRLGAFSRNTIGTRVRTVSTSIENLAAAESVVRDTNFAREIANLARLEILFDAAVLTVNAINANRTSVLWLLKKK